MGRSRSEPSRDGEAAKAPAPAKTPATSTSTPTPTTAAPTPARPSSSAAARVGPRAVVAMQRAAGNAAVGRLLAVQRQEAVSPAPPGLGAELDRLHRALDAGQQAEIDAAVELAGGEGATRTVGDSSTLGGLLGQERTVTVYDERGRPTTVDFGDRPPRFVRRGAVAAPPRAAGPMDLVQAADMATHRRLVEHWWVTRTGQQSWDGQGNIHDELAIRRNADGLAYVRPGSLVS